MTRSDLARFEAVVRRAYLYTDATDDDTVARDLAASVHPFESRNIHPDLPSKVLKLFDDGYYAEATFEAFKFVEKEVKRSSGIARGTGHGLMMNAFNEEKPAIRLNSLQSESEIDEQRGFKNMFAGAAAGIRNPRGHETDLVDTPDLCLDHLAIASVLLRKLDDAGVRA